MHVLEEGGKITQETRLWNSNQGRTEGMRSKEESHDYRYFPEPDLLPLIVSDAWQEEIRKSIPELPEAKRVRFAEQYGLSEYDADVLTQSRELADYYEQVASKAPDAKIAANWVMVELLGALNAAGKEIVNSPVSAENLAQLLELIGSGVLSGKMAKAVFEQMFATGKSAEDVVKELGLQQITDDSQISSIVGKVVAGNPKQLEQYKAGKTALFGFFVGQVMKETKGQANPQKVNELLKAELDSVEGDSKLPELDRPENSELRWLMADLLVARRKRDDWFKCPIFQLFAGGPNATSALNDRIRSCRQTLVNESELRDKANAILKPGDPEFDNKLDDFVAEMVAVTYLSSNGFSKFRFLEHQQHRQPDLEALRNGRQVYVEVKNLRAPLSLLEVAFSQWEANRTREPQKYAFDCRLELNGMNRILDSDQEEWLRKIIDDLGEERRPKKLSYAGPGGVALSFVLNDGAGAMMSSPIGGNLAPIQEHAEQDLVRKLLYQTVGKALAQLYDPSINEDADRAIVFRWKVPDNASLVEQEVRSRVTDAFRLFLQTFFPGVEVFLI
jgi:hypothetical protein